MKQRKEQSRLIGICFNRTQPVALIPRVTQDLPDLLEIDVLMMPSDLCYPSAEASSHKIVRASMGEVQQLNVT
jgi:hypothetical protein